MRLRRRRTINQDPPKGIGSQLPGLSLFVMLLAFFMVLNSMSSYEEQKTDSIMQSIDDTFASKIAEMGNDKPSITKSDEKSLGEGDTIERINALFKAQIPGYDTTLNKRRGLMQIEIPRKDFENAVSGLDGTEEAAESDFAANFLPTLVSLMRADARGTPYRVEITYFLNDSPARVQNQDPQHMADTIRILARIAQDIEKAGLEPRLMTIGLQKGNPQMVDLVFQKHIPFVPIDIKNSKAQAEGETDGQKETQP